MSQSTLPPQLTQWLHNILQPQYSHITPTYKHTLDLISRFRSLKPRTRVHTDERGLSQLLLNIYGTIPSNFQGNTYNIPIELWIPFEYPSLPPIAYIVPTDQMVVKVSNYVDSNGRFYHPVLNNWSNNDLVKLISIMSDIFSRDPPVFAKPPNYHAPPPLPSKVDRGDLVNSGSGSPVPRNPESSVNGSPHNRSVILTSPPRPPRIPTRVETTVFASQGNSLSGVLQAQGTGMNQYQGSPQGQYQAPLQGPPQNQYQPPPQSQYHAPPQGQQYPYQPQPQHPGQMFSPPRATPISYQSTGSSVTSPTQTRQPQFDEPNVIDSDLSQLKPTLTISPIRQETVDSIERKVQALLAQQSLPPITSSVAAPSAPPLTIVQEINQIAENEKQIVAFENNLSSNIINLENYSHNLSDLQNSLHSKIEEIQSYNQQLDAIPAPNIDDVVCGETVVFNQLYDTVSEIKAIDDTLYVINDNYNFGNIKLEMLLKHGRNLAREQFLKKALVEKIRVELGLAREG